LSTIAIRQQKDVFALALAAVVLRPVAWETWEIG